MVEILKLEFGRESQEIFKVFRSSRYEKEMERLHVLACWLCLFNCQGVSSCGPGGGSVAEPIIVPIVILLLHTGLGLDEMRKLGDILAEITTHPWRYSLLNNL